MAEAAKQLQVVEGGLEQMISALRQIVVDPQVDPARMHALLDVQERLLGKQAETDFNAAMNAAQSEIGRVAADASNPQTKSKYASYAALDRVLRPVYAKHGFSLSFDTGDAPTPETIRVLCYVSHRGGHTRTYKVDMPADGKGAKGGDVMTKTHAAGSAMTYGMRYLLKAIFNVAIGEDDDGNAAGKPQNRITEEQAANLRALIDEVKADESKFLKFLGAESVTEILAADYDRAVKALERKRRK